MKKECVYIRGCIFAIMKQIEKGSNKFLVKEDEEINVVEWNEIIEYLIKECEECEKNEF